MREFILGLGAQKSGTSWLYDQLKKQPTFKPGAIKEYHVFDSLYLPECRVFIRRAEENAIQAIKQGPIDSIKKGREFLGRSFQIKLLSMLTDPELYFHYFDRLMDADDCMSADVTPSYSGLPSHAMARIKEGFAEKGIKVKGVFLMREPVTRIESAVRMRLRKEGQLDGATQETLMEEISREAGGVQDILRSSYEATVTEIRKVFDEDEVYFGFYETMFEDSEVQRLAEYFALQSGDFDTNVRVNASKKGIRYPASFLESLKEKYQPNYDFVARDMGFDLRHWDKALMEMAE